MDARMRQDLDNYITGHWGEDQFPHEDMIVGNGHEAAYYLDPLREIYDYDPAEDGPECEAITRILASHPRLVVGGGK